MTDDHLPDQAEIEAAVSKAIRPLLGLPVNPSLGERIAQSMAPILSRLAKRRAEEAAKAITVTQDDKDPTLMRITLSKEFMQGLSAGMLRAMGVTVDPEVPDCAVYQGEGFTWYEADLILHDSRGGTHTIPGRPESPE